MEIQLSTPAVIYCGADQCTQQAVDLLQLRIQSMETVHKVFLGHIVFLWAIVLPVTQFLLGHAIFRGTRLILQFLTRIPESKQPLAIRYLCRDYEIEFDDSSEQRELDELEKEGDKFFPRTCRRCIKHCLTGGFVNLIVLWVVSFFNTNWCVDERQEEKDKDIEGGADKFP